MKVVLDTNIWVSAWLWRGVPGHLIHLARMGKLTLCSSEALLAELANTFTYKKITQKIHSLNFTKEQLMLGTREIATIYQISEMTVPELRDPDDTIVLATAIASQANAIITGDLDLLILGEYQGIQIMTANDFLQQYFETD
jgi:putative PIN family toxin of toxin-antitoxin system